MLTNIVQTKSNPPRVEFVKNKDGNFEMMVFEEDDENGIAVSDFLSEEKLDQVRGVTGASAYGDEVHS
jgi:hypothetical protein